MILLVETPGTAPSAWHSMIQEFRNAGLVVRVVAFPCSGDTTSFKAEIEREQPAGDYTVVAHGIGANLVLNANLHAHYAVLLGPVLGVESSAAIESLTTISLGNRVSLTGDSPALTELGLTGVPMKCVAAAFADEVQHWILDGRVPLPAHPLPMTVFSASLDEIAPVEILIPAARALSREGNSVRIVRLGLGDFAANDVDHGQLLTDRAVLSRLVREVVAQERRPVAR